MFCPNCGGENRSEQNYCRSCGLKLDAISKNVAEQLPSAEYAVLRKRKERFEKLGLGSSAVTAAIGVGAVLSIVGYYKLLLFGPEALIWSSFGAFVLFALLSVFFFSYAKLFLKFENVNPRLSPTDDAGPPSMDKLIDDRPFEPVGSVTEHTTELLISGRDSSKR
ncbi:MAG: hypothetical protein ACKVQJ_05940 [Pyrinomonadaceae bacterium]